MEENYNLKKKVKLKAELENKQKLILKKKYIQLTTKLPSLLLNNEITAKEKSFIKKIIPIKSLKKIESENIIKCKSISKSFNGRPVLKNISFDLNKGQILGLLGPNGSGKTTLFKILAGEIRPDNGEIWLEQSLINNDPIHIRSRKGISYLQTSKGLFENLTAYENLYAVLELHMQDKDKIEQKINRLFSYFGLQYLANIKARHFSAGETKKVATLQRVCNKNISVLLMDEPISALDPISITSIKNFILEIKKMNVSIIITEHNVASISDILDNVILISDGTIIAQGTMKEISKDKNAIKYYLGANFRI